LGFKKWPSWTEVLSKDKTKSDKIPREETNSNVPGSPSSWPHSFLKKFPDHQHVVFTRFKDHDPNNNQSGSPSDIPYDVDAVTNSA
jgi:hypothetical protein